MATTNSDTPSLELDLLRVDKGGKPDLVRENQKKRFKSVERVDKIIELDDLWRQLRFSGDNWNKIKRITCTQVISNMINYVFSCIFCLQDKQG